MTAKIRHDRGPNEAHNQARVLTEISAIWRSALSDAEREYYQTFYEQAKAEYQDQLLEYRATGRYRPSDAFEKVDGSGVWVRKKPHVKNALERELAGYETFAFLPRPPDEEEAYQRRLEASKERRKQKLRLEAAARRLQRKAASDQGAPQN
jgi:SRSO17 transposase